MSRILRSALAIAAGDAVFGLTAVLLFRMAGRDPHAPAPIEFMLASVAVGVIAAAIGGWVTAAIASHHRREHAALLGILIALGALISLVCSTPGHRSDLDTNCRGCFDGTSGAGGLVAVVVEKHEFTSKMRF
jgi:hypothetical protein